MRRHSLKRKKITKIFITVTTVAALSFVGFAIISNIKKEKSQTVAVINGEKITKSEVDQKLRGIFEGQNFMNQSEYKPIEVESLPKDVVEIIVKEIYIEKKLTQEAEKSDAAKLEQTKNKIAETRAKILRQSYIDSIIKTSVTDQKISEKYAELNNEIAGKKEYAISHIVVKDKESAEKLIQELKSKKSLKFSDLAKKYSIDQESGQKGGDLGYILEDNIVKEISTEVTKLKKGEISKPIETKFGWHLIKYTDIREAKALPFEDVKENIKEQLYQEVINGVNSRITKDIKINILISAKENQAQEPEIKAEELKSTNSSEKSADQNLEKANNKSGDKEEKKDSEEIKKSEIKNEKSESKEADKQ